jgi:hypothetical protein
MMYGSNMGRVFEDMNMQAEDIASAYAARVFEDVGDAEASWALRSRQEVGRIDTTAPRLRPVIWNLRHSSPLQKTIVVSWRSPASAGVRLALRASSYGLDVLGTRWRQYASSAASHDNLKSRYKFLRCLVYILVCPGDT